MPQQFFCRFCFDDELEVAPRLGAPYGLRDDGLLLNSTQPPTRSLVPRGSLIWLTLLARLLLLLLLSLFPRVRLRSLHP